MAEIRFRNAAFVVFPFSTLRYAFAGIVLLILLAGGTEMFSQRECAVGKEGFPASFCPEWKEENLTIGRLSVDRILDHESDVVWKSALFQLPQNMSQQRKRILVIGDSFVEGDGLSNVNMTWWRELQRELERRGYWDLDFIAVGRNGASTQAEAEWVENKNVIERFAPDAVLLGFVTNDPDVVDDTGRRVPRIRQRSSVIVGNCLPFAVTYFLQRGAPTLYGRMLDQCTDRAAVLKETEGEEFRYEKWVNELYRSDNLTAYAPIVQRFVTEVRSRVSNFVVVPLIGPLDDVRVKPIYGDVAAMFAQAGARWFDIRDEYLRRFGDRRTWKAGMTANPANAHPGPILTRFYATMIADMFEQEYPDVLGRRRPMPMTIVPRINDAVPGTIELQQEGPDTWSFRTLGHDRPALTWPISRSHAHISFERAVAVQRFTVQSPVDADVTIYGHFIDETDGHIEIAPRFIGRGSGRRLGIEMPDDLKFRRLMSMRIVAEDLSRGSIVEWEMPLVAGEIAKENGNAFNHPLKGIPYPGDNAETPYREALTLYENEKRLGPGASHHAEIREGGSGRYSQWGDTLYFSASDNSDPRSNGRIYRLRKFKPSSRITLAVQFGSPAVRP